MATRSADKSNDLLESMYNNNPQTRMFSRLADSYRKKGNISKAIEICLNGLQYHPSYVTGRIILGRCYLEQENLPKAIEEFKTVCFLDRRNLIAIKMLADIFARQGMHQKAGDLYNILIKMDPFNKSVQKLSSQFKKSDKNDLFNILALAEPASEAWNFTSIPLQDDAFFRDDTGAFSSNDPMELQNSVPYQDEMQSDYSGSIEDTINSIQGVSDPNLNGDDISEHLSSIFEEDSQEPGGQIEQIHPGQDDEIAIQNYPASENVSGEDVTERMDLLFGQTPENSLNHIDQNPDLISSEEQPGPVQNQQQDITSIFSETIQFDRSFLDNASSGSPDNLIQDTTDNFGIPITGADPYNPQDLISDSNTPDFNSYPTDDPNLVDYSHDDGITSTPPNPDFPGQYDLIENSDPDQLISETPDIENQSAFAESTDSEQMQNGYLDLNIFDHSEYSNGQNSDTLASNDDHPESLALPDQPSGFLDLNNDFSVPDFSESENSNDSLQNNTSNDVFISMSDTSDSMQASEDNDFTTFRNIIAGEEQSEDPLQSENLSFDYNLPEEQQTDSAPMQTADSEGAYEASDDIFNTSPMDLLHRRDEEADGLLPQINESEDSLEVKTSVFNNDTQNDFEYLDNSLENIEQPSLQESNVQSHITENTGSENDIFKDDSAGMLVVNETTTPDTSDNTTDSEFIDLMESVQTAEPAEDSFDFDSIQNPSPEDTLSEMSTLQELPEDAFEPQISGSDGDNDLVLDYYSSTDAVNLPDSNPISTENHSEEKSTGTELNIDSMLLSEEFSGSSDNDPKLYSIDDSTDNYMQTASLNQPLTTDSISDNLNEPMVEAEQVEPGTDFIQHYDNQSYQQSVTENSENQDIFDSQSDPASLQVDMNGTLPDTFTDDSSENNTSTPLQSGAEEDVQVEYDEDVISEMDVLVTDSPLGIVSGDDVADKLDQIFSKNNPGSIKEQPANQTGNQAMEQNVSNQQEIYSSDEPVAESTSDYFDNQTDPSSIVPDNEVPSFESYVQASSQFTPEDTGDESSIDHYNSGLQYADNINEPEITTELTGHSPETIPENSISSYSNTPVITAQDLEDRLEEFFPDEDLTLHSQDTDFVDNEDDEDNSEAGGFYTIYGDDAVNSEPLDNLQGIDEVEIVNPIDPASLQDEAGSFYQEWNDACNADEQLTTETIAITPPKNFTGSEATDTFSKTTMTDEDDLSAKPYSIPDHVLTPTLADIYYQQGQYDLAIQIYSRLLEKDPENDTIRIRLQSIQESFEQSNSGTRTPLHTQSEKADPPLKKRKPPVDNRPLAGVRIKKKPKRSTNR